MERIQPKIFKSGSSVGATVVRIKIFLVRDHSIFLYIGAFKLISNNITLGVYTRISSYYEWVRQQVCEKSSYPPASFQCSGDNTEQKLIIEFDLENDGENVTNKVEIDIVHNGE